MSSVTMFINIVFTTPRRTYLPSINILACSKPALENMNLSDLGQNHSRVTILK